MGNPSESNPIGTMSDGNPVILNILVKLLRNAFRIGSSEGLESSNLGAAIKFAGAIITSH